MQTGKNVKKINDIKLIYQVVLHQAVTSLVLSDGVFHIVTLLFFADTGVRTSSIRS